MKELERLADCRDPEEAKRLWLAWIDRMLAEGSDNAEVMQAMKFALLSGRMVIRKRRRKTRGAHPFLAIDFREPPEGQA
jgi:hypothetical protein